jgi:hypothetical protein
MSQRWWVVLCLALLAGCGTPARVIRLDTGGGEPIVRPLSSRSEPVAVDGDALGEALAELVLDVPLSIRPEQAGRRLLASSGDWSVVDVSLQRALRRDYGRWCERYETPGDCLSLLEDGLGMDEFDRLRIAVAFALEPAWEGIVQAVREATDLRVLKAMLVTGVAMYALLLAAPEPLITKSIAVVLTVYMVAYLGARPFMELVRASMRLRLETQQATTFAALEESGVHFGRVLGANGARIAILLVTVVLGSKGPGLAARGPGLPGFSQAAAAAEAEAGLVLSAASSVRSIAVRGNGLLVGLAPGAVAMTAQGPGGGAPRPEGQYTAYRSVDASGKTQYVGLTNNLARRAAEQLRSKGIQIEKLLGNVSREDARAVEQALIEIHGLRKNGGTLLNHINSVAQSNPKYAELLRRGMQLLESIGYQGG